MFSHWFRPHMGLAIHAIMKGWVNCTQYQQKSLISGYVFSGSVNLALIHIKRNCISRSLIVWWYADVKLNISRITFFLPSSHNICSLRPNWNCSQSKGHCGGGGINLFYRFKTENEKYVLFCPGCQWVGLWLSVCLEPIRPPWLLSLQPDGAVPEGEAEATAVGGLWLRPQVPPL